MLSRACERWYALQVSFFNDVESAKQVARSVRSDARGLRRSLSEGWPDQDPV
jgi:hypothetical protein